MKNPRRKLSNMMQNAHVFRRLYLQKQLEGIDIHPRQIPMLEYVQENDGCTQVELARALHVSAASIAQSTKRLQKAGLLEKQVNEESLRQNKLSITQKGKEMLEETHQIFKSVGTKMFEGFSESDLMDFERLIQKMLDNLSDGADTRLSPINRAALINKLK